MTDYSALDPLRFWLNAAELLPRDPAEATVRDLQVLASTSLGLARLVVQIGAEIAALDDRMRATGASVADEAGAIAQLEALRARGEVARRRLKSYTRTAAVACGLDPATGELAAQPNGPS
jgi:hypothetical protein